MAIQSKGSTSFGAGAPNAEAAEDDPVSSRAAGQAEADLEMDLGADEEVPASSRATVQSEGSTSSGAEAPDAEAAEEDGPASSRGAVQSEGGHILWDQGPH